MASTLKLSIPAVTAKLQITLNLLDHVTDALTSFGEEEHAKDAYIRTRAATRAEDARKMIYALQNDLAEILRDYSGTFRKESK